MILSLQHSLPTPIVQRFHMTEFDDDVPPQSTSDDLQGDGARSLVVKGVDAIEAIQNGKEYLTKSGNMYSCEFCRLMRRDYNKLSAKMYRLSLNSQRKLRIQFLLDELEGETAALEDMARKFEFPVTTGLLAVVAMRIVCDRSEKLFDILIRADRAYTKLLESPMQEVAPDNLVPFYRAYGALKRFVFGHLPAGQA